MNDDIVVIDDLIPKDYQNYVETVLTGWEFSWIMNSSVVSPDKEFKGRADNPVAFQHFFYENQQPKSPFFNLVYPIVLSITSHARVPFNRLYRMRANLTVPIPNMENYLMPHIDSFYPHWNAIYYVNDSDGDTVIFNETNENYDAGTADIQQIESGNFTIKQRISPKKGRFVAFPGKYYHSLFINKENPYRIILNINLGSVL